MSSEAAYFADQAGSWQIEEAADASRGLIMRQNVPDRPICWSGDYSPYTIIGDVKWADMSVTVDAFIEPDTPGAVFVVRCRHYLRPSLLGCSIGALPCNISPSPLLPSTGCSHSRLLHSSWRLLFHQLRDLAVGRFNRL